MLAKGTLMGFGAVLCAAIPSMIETHFTQQQMANSLLPFLVMVGAPFLVSLIVSAIQPNSNTITAAWIVLAAGAFVAGDVHAIFHIRGGDSNLWPVELVMSGGIATGALIAGAAAGARTEQESTGRIASFNFSHAIRQGHWAGTNLRTVFGSVPVPDVQHTITAGLKGSYANNSLFPDLFKMAESW